MKVVFDTNIYVSAFLRGGLAEQLIEFSRKDLIRVFISPDILRELRQTLLRKFRLKKEDLDQFIEFVCGIGKMVEPKKLEIEPPIEDKEDIKILECALTAEAHLIVSLDHHLLKLKKFRNISIVHPKALSWMIPD